MSGPLPRVAVTVRLLLPDRPLYPRGLGKAGVRGEGRRGTVTLSSRPSFRPEPSLSGHTEAQSGGGDGLRLSEGFSWVAGPKTPFPGPTPPPGVGSLPLHSSCLSDRGPVPDCALSSPRLRSLTRVASESVESVAPLPIRPPARPGRTDAVPPLLSPSPVALRSRPPEREVDGGPVERVISAQHPTHLRVRVSVFVSACLSARVTPVAS